jgi:hypothetical protein
MEWEWPFWRLVQKGHSISEIKTWNLEQIYKVLTIIEMDNDHEKAIEGYQEMERKRKSK